jgi:hypothetical protein
LVKHESLLSERFWIQRRWERKREGLFLAIVQGGEGDESENVDLNVQASVMARKLKRNFGVIIENGKS